MTSARRIVLKAFRRPAFWGWLCLASLPPELISHAQGWELVDPAYVGLLLLWWPLDTLGRLGALRELLQPPSAGSGQALLRQPWTALPSALAAEILLGLRSGVWALVGLIPGIALFSYLGAETMPRRLAVAALLLAGLLPSAVYVLRRLLAPRQLLLAPLSASAALESSATALQGRLRSFLLMAAPFIVASWALDGLSLELPWALALGLGPLGLALELLPLALLDRPPKP